MRFQLAAAALAGLRARRALVLDAGCGEGLLAAALARGHPGWQIVGVDINEQMLRRARDRARRQGLRNLEFHHADITQPLGAARYDAVLAMECLVEVPDDDAALGAMAAALRSGGLFLAHLPQDDWKPVLAASEPTWRYEVRHGYTDVDIAQRLARFGVSVLAITPTTRGTLRLAQELRDRIKDRGLKTKALAYPAVLAAVWLERHGLTWGSPRAFMIQGVKA
jgi:SAM-dependent methyltransferase